MKKNKNKNDTYTINTYDTEQIKVNKSQILNHEHPINCICFDDSGELCLLGGHDGSLYSWANGGSLNAEFQRLKDQFGF